MSWLSKALKKVKKPLVAVARKAVNLATGGLSEKALTVAKGISALTKKKKGENIKIQPVSVRAVIARNTVPSGGRIRSSVATTMPGGAPLKTRSTKKRKPAKKPKSGATGAAATKRAASKKLLADYNKNFRGSTPGHEDEVYTPRKKGKKAPAKPKVKRKAPTGGLDLKALSTSWKAAGKPGTWQEWIKANK